jgi:hypothetical protein
MAEDEALAVEAIVRAVKPTLTSTQLKYDDGAIADVVRIVRAVRAAEGAARAGRSRPDVRPVFRSGSRAS